MIFTLLALYTDAAEILDRDGYLPLYKAIKLKRSDEIILDLLYANAGTVKEICDGHLPLCKAIDKKYSDQVLLAFLNVMTVQDDEFQGTYLFNKAIELKRSDEVILAILQKYNKALERNYTLNAHPLHMAIQFKLSDHIILTLLDSNKEATTKMCSGCLPLHIAIQLKCSDEVILSILATNNQATKLSNGDGNLPLHLAIKKQAL